MDKTVMFAVAGAGKTTYIINQLSSTKRSLIVTYTDGNYINLYRKICDKFGGKFPENVTLMTYFKFLYSFCYKPFWADTVKAKGIFFENNQNRYAKQTEYKYYISPNGYFYSNRLAFFLENAHSIDDIIQRLETYFDEFIIDEIQDIAGRDFNFLEKLMSTKINMLFVGDFFQHTFDTSRDGTVNKNLFSDKSTYEARFTAKGFKSDTTTLLNSWRCSQSVCSYIDANLGINISSNRTQDDDTKVYFVSEIEETNRILTDDSIIKLHYQNGAKYGICHKNWGETKGEDHYQDVCILLNKTTAAKFSSGKLTELPPSTKNKLYVAITRARGNVYFINE